MNCNESFRAQNVLILKSQDHLFFYKLIKYLKIKISTNLVLRNLSK